MLITIGKPITVEITQLRISCHPRYWQDTIINDLDDRFGVLVPGRVDDRWEATFDIDKGKILNWPKEMTASIYYYFEDCGVYELIDSIGEIFYSTDNQLVPRLLCPKRNGYGDYIIMDIDGDGNVADWDFTNLSEHLLAIIYNVN
jgi:hypothetical protein